MDKTFTPHSIESKWYSFWEKSNYFKANESTPSYSIVLPPPNVTGSLHMGHAFQDTLMDILIRYHRMKGHGTLWQPGIDHAGIATQMVVERQLNQAGQSRHELGREAFIDKIWAWKEESGNMIGQQMRRLGASLDWSRECFTMDPKLCEAVTEVFIQLYDEGLIYRGKRLVNWDPKLQTAVSDLEVISEEEEGHLWHIKYPVASSEMHLVVATTRPETLLGDVAVAVHPEDPRYQHLIGEHVQLPLTQRLIPIISDEYVDPEFGTGCVKITPAHDFNDYEVGARHGLAMINILDDHAHLNQNVPTAYQGLERFLARERIIEDLKKEGLLDKIEPHTLKVPRGDRTGEVIEPYLTDQWFVKTKGLAQEALEAVKKERIQFVPDHWTKVYYEWMNNIQDWCISRQLWWGHRIPAWFDPQGKIYVARSEEEARLKYNLSPNIELTQEEDVLDTWFSSALWPFTTLGWPQNTSQLETFYPTSVLVTGFDIIFFWVARMIMMGLKFQKEVPFKTVYVHGLIQDAEGKKMSKSKGNVIDPIDLIDGIDIEALVKKRVSGLMQPKMAKKVEAATRKFYPEGIPSYGTDALRFTFCSIATTSRHIRFDDKRILGYRNFCNKLWNAARFVWMNTQDGSIDKPDNFNELTVIDKWIWTECQETKRILEKHINEYRFDLFAQVLYRFTWDHYCDWYVEFAKAMLTESHFDERQKNNTRYTLVAVLEELLRLMHPIMPFITEEIWQRIHPLLAKTPNDSSLMIQAYPEFNADEYSQKAKEDVQWVQKVISGIRNIRGEMNLGFSLKVDLYCYSEDHTQKEKFDPFIELIQNICKVKSIQWITKEEHAPVSATALVGDLHILVPLAGLIDKDKEVSRLNKDIEKINKDLTRCQTKLNKPSFIEKAPKDIIQKEKDIQQELHNAKEKLVLQLEKISQL